MKYIYQRKESNIAGIIVFICWLASIYLLCSNYLSPEFIIYALAPFTYLLSLITQNDDDLNNTYDVLCVKVFSKSLEDMKILDSLLFALIISIAASIQYWLISKLGVYSNEQIIEYSVILLICSWLSTVIGNSAAVISTMFYIKENK